MWKRLRIWDRSLTALFVTLVFLIYHCPTAVGINTEEIAKLEAQLAAAEETAKGSIFLALSKAHGIDNPEDAYWHAEQAEALAVRSNDRPLLVEATMLMGRWSRYTPFASERAHYLIDHALELSRKENLADLECAILLEKANVAWWDFDRVYFDSLVVQAKDLARTLDNDVYLGQALHMSGRMAYQRYETEIALAEWQEALGYFEEAGAWEQTLDLKMDLSVLYLRTRQPKEAQRLSNEANALARAQQSDYWQVHTLINKGMNLWVGRDSLNILKLDTLLEDLLQIAPKCKNAYGQLKFNYFVSRHLRDVGAGDQALPYGEDYLQQAKDLNIQTHIVQASFFLSPEYSRRGRADLALQVALDAKDIALDLDYRVTRLYDLISGLYRRSGELELALEYVDKSMAYERERGFPVGYYFFYYCYTDYAELYLAMDSMELAYAYHDSALTIAVENSDVEKEFSTRVAVGFISFNEGNYERAEQDLNDALSTLAAFGGTLDIKIVSRSHSLGAELYFAQGKYQRAVFHAEKALEINKQVNWNESIKLNHNLLWQAYEGLGDHQNALRHMKAYNQIKDSIFTAENNARYMALREQFEADEKQHEIDLLQRDKELAERDAIVQQTSASRTQLILWLVVGLVVIMIIAAMLLFNRYKLRRRAAALALENERLQLEEENKKATQELEMMELRSSFFTNVSHEIRTPLTLIKGPLELLKNDPNALSQEWIESMERNTDRLMKLVNQAVRLSRGEEHSAPFNPAPVNLAAFVKELAKAFRPLAIQKEISLDVQDHSGEAYGNIDRERLELALINLLGNAFRYTGPGGAVTVILNRAGKGADEQLSLIVKDTGQGIAAEHLPHLFERYYRADANPSTGFGLGLSLVKEAVEQHGGTLSVDSTPQAGTSFRMLLPLAQDEASRSVAEAPSPPKTAVSALATNVPAVEMMTETVLVVEDNVEIRQFLAEVLSKHYRVITAVDGKDGEEQARTLMPDLIVSDIMMPNRDGYELVQSLKEDLQTSHIPVLLLTAKATHEDKIQGLKVGADDYLYKPVSPEELLLRLGNLIKQRERIQRSFSAGSKPAEEPANTLSGIDATFLEKARAIVESHLDNEAFSIAQFCEEIALNRTSVHHKLKALTGFNATGFIKSIRIQKAMTLIREGNDNLMDVASQTGFSNRHTFNRAFKEQIGKTPSAYRDENFEVTNGPAV